MLFSPLGQAAMHRQPPLLLITGATGVGKSTIAQQLAFAMSGLPIVEFDAIHAMFPRPLLSYWAGPDGVRQRMKAEGLFAFLVRDFLQTSSAVIATDVVNEQTLRRYQSALSPHPVVVILLKCDRDEAHRRFASRAWRALSDGDWERVYDSFSALHSADIVLDVTHLQAEEAVRQLAAAVDCYLTPS